MTKKILLIMFLTIVAISCGKKGDPVYQNDNKKTELFIIQYTLFS